MNTKAVVYIARSGHAVALLLDLLRMQLFRFRVRLLRLLVSLLGAVGDLGLHALAKRRRDALLQCIQYRQAGGCVRRRVVRLDAQRLVKIYKRGK